MFNFNHKCSCTEAKGNPHVLEVQRILKHLANTSSADVGDGQEVQISYEIQTQNCPERVGQIQSSSSGSSIILIDQGNMYSWVTCQCEAGEQTDKAG